MVYLYSIIILFTLKMNYKLIQETIGLIESFEQENAERENYSQDLQGFKRWIIDGFLYKEKANEPNWEGKSSGRSPESVINTLLVHLNRYAKNYSKAAIYESEFSTQEDFIYLINLKAFGEMSKMDLIKRNVQDKSGGMLIIRRLQKNEWIEERDSKKDRRSKLIRISEKGLKALNQQMRKIREATTIVAGNLEHHEKLELIRLLQKLDDFHQEIYDENIETSRLLNLVTKNHIKK